MMIRVFYTEIASDDTAETYLQLLRSYPQQVQERISRYHTEKERRLRITGKALLVYALKEMGLYPGLSLEQYALSDAQQPYLKGAGFSFSISHSGNMAVCAVTSDGKVGVDIERVKPVKLELMNFYFAPSSWQLIVAAPDSTMAFYEHWTAREAAIKASGLGIEQMELADIVTDEDGTVQLREETYYSRILSLRYDYICCVASDRDIDEVSLTDLNMTDLL